MVEEFCKVVVSRLTHGIDALVHMLGRVSLATYINQSNDKFVPRLQSGGTCYANVIAAVFHLAMNRIIGRERGVPRFSEILERIVREYGEHGAYVHIVLNKVCAEYRLHYREVDEFGARQAINERRPVVAIYSWKDKQSEMFQTFYEKSPKGILSSNDIAVDGKYIFIVNLPNYIVKLLILVCIEIHNSYFGCMGIK